MGFDILNKIQLKACNFKKTLCGGNFKSAKEFIQEVVYYISVSKFCSGELVINSRRKTVQGKITSIPSFLVKG